jgi:hypothetical protein
VIHTKQLSERQVKIVGVEVTDVLELTEEQSKLVQRHIPAITMLMAYHRKFGEEALNVAREWAFSSGRRRGEEAKRRTNLVGTDARAMEALFNSLLPERYDEETIRKKLTRISAEKNRTTSVCEGFCPVMAAVKMLRAPWKIVCENYSVPFHLGLASAINPSVKGELPKARWKGDECCQHIAVIEE